MPLVIATTNSQYAARQISRHFLLARVTPCAITASELILTSMPLHAAGGHKRLHHHNVMARNCLVAAARSHPVSPRSTKQKVKRPTIWQAPSQSCKKIFSFAMRGVSAEVYTLIFEHVKATCPVRGHHDSFFTAVSVVHSAPPERTKGPYRGYVSTDGVCSVTSCSLLA